MQIPNNSGIVNSANEKLRKIELSESRDRFVPLVGAGKPPPLSPHKHDMTPTVGSGIGDRLREPYIYLV